MIKYLLLLSGVAYVSCISRSRVFDSLANSPANKNYPAQQETVPVEIVSRDSQVNPEEGTFKWSYETSDGTKVQQSGEVDPNNKDRVKSIEGSYSYTDPEGKSHLVNYVANENGFFPSSDDIAPEILKHLEFAASNPHPIYTED